MCSVCVCLLLLFLLLLLLFLLLLLLQLLAALFSMALQEALEESPEDKGEQRSIKGDSGEWVSLLCCGLISSSNAAPFAKLLHFALQCVLKGKITNPRV